MEKMCVRERDNRKRGLVYLTYSGNPNPSLYFFLKSSIPMLISSSDIR